MVAEVLQRKIYEKLESWKNTKEKKALCIIGARQIGKTTIIREFGRRNYKHFVESDLSRVFFLCHV